MNGNVAKIDVIGANTINKEFVNANDYKVALTKVFGQYTQIRNPYESFQFKDSNANKLVFKHTDMLCLRPPKGFYPISDDYIQNQPTIPMRVYLKDC